MREGEKVREEEREERESEGERVRYGRREEG